MQYELSGKIKLVSPKQTFNSGFEKQEFVVTTQEKYPQDIKLEVVKDNIAKLERFAVGDQVNVKFNLRGNEWNDKYFVNLQAWDIAPMGAPASQGSSSPQNTSPEPEMGGPASGPAPTGNHPNEDDLPF